MDVVHQNLQNFNISKLYYERVHHSTCHVLILAARQRLPDKFIVERVHGSISFLIFFIVVERVHGPISFLFLLSECMYAWVRALTRPGTRLHNEEKTKTNKPGPDKARTLNKNKQRKAQAPEHNKDIQHPPFEDTMFPAPLTGRRQPHTP